MTFIRLRRLWRLLPVLAVTGALANGVFASPSSATTFGGKLLAGNWTSSPQETFWKWERSEASGSNCVGPVTYNGTFHFPYGWSCNGSISEITVPNGWYHAGIKNQTGSTIQFSVLFV